MCNRQLSYNRGQGSGPHFFRISKEFKGDFYGHVREHGLPYEFLLPAKEEEFLDGTTEVIVVDITHTEFEALVSRREKELLADKF